jgi:Uma2 family endonuclease
MARQPKARNREGDGMSLRRKASQVSVAEYLAGEKDSPVRHEYVDGQVYAMAGASDRHNRIAGNLYARLSTHLGDGPCEPFISDMKVKVAANLYYYPDVMVSCDGPGSDAYVRSEPRLIIEVISPSTERTDRHEKMTAYKQAASLQEYALVMQDRMQVELHRRQADGQWSSETFSQPDAEVQFNSVGLSLSVSEIYRNVRWESADAE